MKKAVVLLFIILILIDIRLFYNAFNKKDGINLPQVQQHEVSNNYNGMNMENTAHQNNDEFFNENNKKPLAETKNDNPIPKVTYNDWGEYMKALEKKIKSNWNPPKSDESKKIVAVFKIAKDGSLLSTEITTSSNNAVADNAAIQAIKISAPFEPLPDFYTKDSVKIEFTFDYNVLHRSKYE